MKLIMRSLYDELRQNDDNSYAVNTNGEDQIVKIFRDDKLIAKRVKKKKKISYFGIKNCEQFIKEVELE